jgi:hypothetical protein
MGRSVPARLRELAALGQTLTRRAADVLVYFDRPRTINGHLLEILSNGSPEVRGHPAGWQEAGQDSPSDVPGVYLPCTRAGQRPDKSAQKQRARGRRGPPRRAQAGRGHAPG